MPITIKQNDASRNVLTFIMDKFLQDMEFALPHVQGRTILEIIEPKFALKSVLKQIQLLVCWEHSEITPQTTV